MNALDVLKRMARERLSRAAAEPFDDWQTVSVALEEFQALREAADALAEIRAGRPVDEKVAAPKSGTGTPPSPWDPHEFRPYSFSATVTPGCVVCGQGPADRRHLRASP